MATQGVEEKQFSSEHVEKVNGAQSDSSGKDEHIGEKGENVDHVHLAEQGDKLHAMRIDGDEEDHMYVLKQARLRCLNTLVDL